MEKKIKFSNQNTVSKVVYLTVIAILCVSALIIGIVASNNKKKPADDTQNPPISDGTGESTDNGGNNGGAGEDEGENKPAGLTFVSPATGTVIKSHSTTTPVFSNTLEEWRIHTGLDIMADEGDEVVAVSVGKVTNIYHHPMLGDTVEITHSDTHKSVYSNLDMDTVNCAVGDTVEAGSVIGYIGDTTVSELADEPHLHFELYVDGKSVNPLDYFTEESMLECLGIVSGSEDGEV